MNEYKIKLSKLNATGTVYNEVPLSLVEEMQLSALIGSFYAKTLKQRSKL